MLDIKFIRQNPEKIKKACQDKQVKININQLLKLDKERRKLISELEKIKAFHNKASRAIARLTGKGKKIKIIEAKKIAGQVEKLAEKLDKVEPKFNQLMLGIPNPALADVKVGKDESGNKILRHWGRIPEFNFKIKDHIQLGKDLDLIDTGRAAKVSGSRFAYLKNGAAFLEYAIVQFVFTSLIKEKFTPIVPPALIKPKPMRAMGYLERGGEEVYQTIRDRFYLVGTAEQSVGPMHMDEILPEKGLPKRYVAFSTCFRREAGSYGRDVKGILRVHQFDKVEMFSFCQPEKSQEEHKFLLAMEEKLVQSLKIPYQVVKMCTGDLGDPAASKYDIECWMPGQGKYRETHSTSNCTDFQARRLNIRFRSKEGKVEFVHTLNGTAFAIGRILIAILENYQQKDGSVKIPAVLQKYVGIKLIEKR